MWEASAPRASATQTAKACADGVRDRDVAQRLLRAASELESNSNSFRAAARGDTLHTVTAANYSVTGMTDDEMKSLYNSQLGRSDRRNLIPACSRCNHHLLSYWSGLQDDQFLHPYAMPWIGRWLRAVVVPGEPVSVMFYASPDPGLHAPIQTRIVNEFRTLGLALLFSIVSGPDIAEMDAVLSSQFLPNNGGIVQAHLYEAASAALATDPNSRRGALFEALANDQAYCEGGYLVTMPITI
jgi:hypothetical protein